MRLEWKEGQNGTRLLDDTYSNDLDGLKIAIPYLGQYGQPAQRRILIVSDFPQTGAQADLQYADAAEIIAIGAFEKVYVVGPQWNIYKSLLPKKTCLFPDTEALLADLHPAALAGGLILIKGGRAFGFERIVKRLQKLSHGTQLEIDLGAVVSNLNYYRARLPKSHKVMAMVKAGAYGAGSYEIASTLAYQKIDYLAVAYVDEGVSLRNHGIALPIMVLNCQQDQFGECLRYKLEPTLYSLPMIEAWINFIASTQAILAIHIELNTGMNRLGLDASDTPGLLALLAQAPPYFKIASVYTHLAASDDPAQDTFTREQLAAYRKAIVAIESIWTQPFLKHAANTAGAIRFPDAALDMVRLGIGLYGVEVGGENGALTPIGHLKTFVNQVRTVPAGQSVSYGHKWVFDTPRRIATVAIGYADGLPRKLGNGAFSMHVHGGLAPTVGSICMDMTMLDVTGLPEVAVGDSVTVFDATNKLDTIAQLEGTIPYEILTRISDRVRRVYVSD
jgi:Alr-MurF fusion protein